MDMIYVQPLGTIIFTVIGGILALILAEKSRIPSILFLLIFGILLGPEFANLVQPQIFEENFPYYISLMVALILFEGGADLKFSQFREISRSVRNLLSIGVLTTLILVALAAHYFAGLSWNKAILFGSIMVVTGPTVVIPILKRLHVRENVHNILKWEAILIDPLGVVIAVVLFEFLLLQEVGIVGGFFLFAARILVGMLFGLLAGWIIYQGFTRKWLLRMEGDEIGGLFLLGTVLLFYGLAEWTITDSGLVAATTAGIFIGNKKFPHQQQSFHFQRQVTLFALSILFILLSSNVPVHTAKSIIVEGLILIALLIVVIRPFSVFLSTWNDHKLSFREKLFLGSVAPRGIVSASLASLFAIAFEGSNLGGEGIFLPLAFFVISGTIVFYAILSDLSARFLGVHEGVGKGIVIIGANELGMLYARELRKHHIKVIFIDTNPYFCNKVRQDNFEAYLGSGFNKEFIESLDLKGIGKMIAITPNHEVNVLSCQTFAGFLSKNSVYRVWDKTDNWEKISSPHAEESWGKPLLISLKVEDLEIWEYVEVGEYRVESKKLTEAMEINLDNITKSNISYPLFAVTGQDIQLFYPHNTISAGSEVYYLQPTASKKKEE